MVTLSVVVPATNAPPTLARCTDALGAAHDQPDEVIVVEDAGLTASEARNAGVARANGDVVLFVDADVEVHADVVGRVRAAFAAAPGLTALFGSYDDTPDDPRVVSAFRNLLHHHVHQAGAGPAETFWTGLGAVRRQPFLAIGGFDEERYRHPSIEDIELGDRLRARGGTIELDPAIQGTHLKRWTLCSMLWTDLVHRGIPWISLQARTRRVANSLNCGWRHRLSAAACLLVMTSVLLGWPAVLAASAGAMVALNRAFYLFLLHRQGPLHALAGIGLHGLHHLVAVIAVPAGIVAAACSWALSPGPADAPVIGRVTAE